MLSNKTIHVIQIQLLILTSFIQSKQFCSHREILAILSLQSNLKFDFFLSSFMVHGFWTNTSTQQHSWFNFDDVVFQSNRIQSQKNVIYKFDVKNVLFINWLNLSRHVSENLALEKHCECVFEYFIGDKIEREVKNILLQEETFECSIWHVVCHEVMCCVLAMRLFQFILTWTKTLCRMWRTIWFNNLLSNRITNSGRHLIEVFGRQYFKNYEFLAM